MGARRADCSRRLRPSTFDRRVGNRGDHRVAWLHRRAHPSRIRFPRHGGAGRPRVRRAGPSTRKAGSSGGTGVSPANRLALQQRRCEPRLCTSVAHHVHRRAAAAPGLFVGWYFNLFSWPYLVLWADEFLLLCALWMTCGVLAIREEHWRVPLAFALGGLAFVIVSATGRDALLAQMIGAGTVLTAAAIQVPRVFTRSGFEEQPSVVPLPRMTVLLYRTLPFFWYGTLYFCFLFADRLAASASVSALTGAPFGLRPQYKLGMDLALLTFLFAAAGVEYGNIRFTDLLTRAMRDPFDQNARVFQQRVSRIHLRVLGIVVCGFIPIAAIVGTLARRLLPGEPEAVWTTVAIGDVGYLLLAIGLANALALFSLNRPWSAGKALTAGLIVNLTVGYVLSHMVSPYFAAAGLVAGAFVLAVESSVAVRRTIRSDGDHAVSSAV